MYIQKRSLLLRRWFFFSLLMVITRHFGMASTPNPPLSDIDRISLKYWHDADFVDAMYDHIDDCINRNDIGQTDQKGNNLFHWAITIDSGSILNNCYKLLSHAKSHKTDIRYLLRAKNSSNLTPLHLAAQNDMKSPVREFLLAGAEIDALGQEHMNPLEILFVNKKAPFNILDMIILLFSKGARVRPQFLSDSYAFMNELQSQAEHLSPLSFLYGDILERAKEKEEMIKKRKDALNFISLLLERENNQSHLHQLPKTVFGMAFGYIYNFYTNNGLHEYNPFQISNNS